jgi:hypothetical protein
MPIISDRVEVERKPRLGGGGPGKIPHRRGFGGGDDGDHGNSGDFRSREQRMRRYRIAMSLCIISVTAIFVVLTMIYVFRMGKGRFDEDAHRWVRDWIPLTLPYLQLWINSLILLLSSLTLELDGEKRRVHCNGDCSSTLQAGPALAWHHGLPGFLLSCRTGPGVEHPSCARSFSSF